MVRQQSTPTYIKNTILYAIAIFIAVIIYYIETQVPPSIALGGVYCLVILYSWILPGKNISIYTGFFCTVLIILAMINKSESIPQGGLVGLNTFISIIVVWICVTLVSAAKSGYAGMERVMLSLEDKVWERTNALNKSRKGLEISEKAYKYLYENSNEMHASVDFDDNHILRCNDTLCKKLGYSKEELLDQPVELLYHSSCIEVFEKSLLNFKTEGHIKNVELQLRTKTGDKIEVILNVTSVKSKEGKITNCRFSWTDITELKRLNIERIAYAQRLEIKNKELEQFTFIASHDLQEPLRTVTSFSEILSNEYFDKFDQTGKDSINFILEATGRMQNLVKGLLDYSRLGKDANKEKIDFNEILSNLKKDLSLKIIETDTEFEYKKLPENFMGYKSELIQLFLNLIINSMKFRVKDRVAKIKISSTVNDAELLFCVEDNGIGISKNHQDKIFKIFKRIYSRKKYEGTGIGLAHCQKIVDLHGGKIWVESELGMGSKFYFTLKN